MNGSGNLTIRPGKLRAKIEEIAERDNVKLAQAITYLLEKGIAADAAERAEEPDMRKRIDALEKEVAKLKKLIKPT